MTTCAENFDEDWHENTEEDWHGSMEEDWHVSMEEDSSLEEELGGWGRWGLAQQFVLFVVGVVCGCVTICMLQLSFQRLSLRVQYYDPTMAIMLNYYPTMVVLCVLSTISSLTLWWLYTRSSLYQKSVEEDAGAFLSEGEEDSNAV